MESVVYYYTSKFGRLYAVYNYPEATHEKTTQNTKYAHLSIISAHIMHIGPTRIIIIKTIRNNIAIWSYIEGDN